MRNGRFITHIETCTLRINIFIYVNNLPSICDTHNTKNYPLQNCSISTIDISTPLNLLHTWKSQNDQKWRSHQEPGWKNENKQTKKMKWKFTCQFNARNLWIETNIEYQNDTFRSSNKNSWGIFFCFPFLFFFFSFSVLWSVNLETNRKYMKC